MQDVIQEPLVLTGAHLRFTLHPVFDPRSPDAWRADFKRLARLLQTD